MAIVRFKKGTASNYAGASFTPDENTVYFITPESDTDSESESISHIGGIYVGSTHYASYVTLTDHVATDPTQAYFDLTVNGQVKSIYDKASIDAIISDIETTLAGGIHFKGTAASSYISALSANDVENGDMYIVSESNGTIDGKSVQVGDTVIIGKSETAVLSYFIIEKNIEGNPVIYNTSTNGKQIAIGTNGEINYLADPTFTTIDTTYALTTDNSGNKSWVEILSKADIDELIEDFEESLADFVYTDDDWRTEEGGPGAGKLVITNGGRKDVTYFPMTANDNGKVLGIVNGALAWVVQSGGAGGAGTNSTYIIHGSGAVITDPTRSASGQPGQTGYEPAEVLGAHTNITFDETTNEYVVPDDRIVFECKYVTDSEEVGSEIVVTEYIHDYSLVVTLTHDTTYTFSSNENITADPVTSGLGTVDFSLTDNASPANTQTASLNVKTSGIKGMTASLTNDMLISTNAVYEALSWELF